MVKEPNFSKSHHIFHKKVPDPREPKPPGPRLCWNPFLFCTTAHRPNPNPHVETPFYFILHDVMTQTEPQPPCWNPFLFDTTGHRPNPNPHVGTPSCFILQDTDQTPTPMSEPLLILYYRTQTEPQPPCWNPFLFDTTGHRPNPNPHVGTPSYFIPQVTDRTTAPMLETLQESLLSPERPGTPLIERLSGLPQEDTVNEQMSAFKYFPDRESQKFYRYLLYSKLKLMRKFQVLNFVENNISALASAPSRPPNPTLTPQNQAS